MNNNLRLIVVAGFGVAVFTIATLASKAILSPAPSTWQPATRTPENVALAKNFLCIEGDCYPSPNTGLKPVPLTKAIDYLMIQNASSRFTVYRFSGRETCGRKGCLHVVKDNTTQQKKSFVFIVPPGAKQESYLSVENDCVVGLNVDSVKIPTKYSLCLKL